MSIKNLHTLLAVAGVMAMGATAVAQSEFESVTLTPTTAGTTSTITFDVPQFNLPGTLNSVTLTLTPSFGNFGPEVFNSSFSPQLATSIGVNNPAGTLADSAIGLTAAWSGVQSPSGQTESATVSPFSLYVGTPQTFTFTAPPTSVSVGPAGFTGAGDDDLTFTGTATATSMVTGTSVLASFYGNVGGELDVTYYYTAVPEPTTISLLVTGLLGAWTIRRRKA
jgi:hypothetical protein